MVAVVSEVHECGGCGLSFSQIKHLRDHVKDVHPNFKLPSKKVVEVDQMGINKMDEVEEETNKADGNFDFPKDDTESDIQHSPSSLFHYDKIKNSFKQGRKKSYQEFYLDLRAARYKTLLKNDGGIKFNGTTIDNDEIMTPTIESEIVLDWLEGIDERLPEYIEQKYQIELLTVSLLDLQIEISRNLDAYLVVLDIKKDEVAEFQNKIESPSTVEMKNLKNTEVTEVDMDQDQECNLELGKEDPIELNSKEKSTSADDDYVMMDYSQINEEENEQVMRKLKTTLKGHKCNLCNKLFSRINNLKQHIVAKHKGFNLPEENIVKNNEVNLEINEKENDQISKGYNCNLCSKSFSANNLLEQHAEDEHTHEPRFCTFCGRMFKNETYLTQHLKQFHKEKVSKNHIMAETTSTDNDHIVINNSEVKKESTIEDNEHNIRDTSEIKEEPDDSVFLNSAKSKIKMEENGQVLNEFEDKSESYKCDVCSKKFSKIANLNKHLQHVHKNKLTKKEKDEFKCDHCGAEFPGNFKLTMHLRVHTGEKPFSCEECGKTFSQAGSLREHVKLHNGQKDHLCDDCGESFIRKSKLVIHRRIHTGERPFQCDECDKGFRDSTKLNQHKLTHASVKPFQCDDCGKSFITNTKMLIHKRRSHTGEKPYQCDECEQSFDVRSKLTFHKRRHTGVAEFVCDTCNKGFFDFGSLNKHKKYHFDERKYSCEQCGKAFFHPSMLKQHFIIHTGERPFPCEVCHKRFSKQNNLKVHMRLHTGEKPFMCNICGVRKREQIQVVKHMKHHMSDMPNFDKSSSLVNF